MDAVRRGMQRTPAAGVRRQLSSALDSSPIRRFSAWLDGRSVILDTCETHETIDGLGSFQPPHAPGSTDTRSFTASSRSQGNGLGTSRTRIGSGDRSHAGRGSEPETLPARWRSYAREAVSALGSEPRDAQPDRA